MTMATKQAILKEKLNDYLKANKAGKGKILDQVVGVTELNRKAVIRRFRVLQMTDQAKIERRGRKTIYGSEITSALKEIWSLFNEICAERLKPQLPEYIRVLKSTDNWQYKEQITNLLLKMSLATVKRRIAGFTRAKYGNRGKNATKPSNLREIIPIRRGSWKNPEPGFGEVDTIAHCGTSLIGDYAYSVQYTDVSTIWTCLSAQWNKGEIATRKSIERIKAYLPFTLLGIDPDSGGEFINWQLYHYCLENEIEFTRGRPYAKNDNAHIEQKNYTHVRKLIGYERLDKDHQLKKLNDLYRKEWELYKSFFIPNKKLISKKRVGSKIVKKYDKPQTPYRRILEHKRFRKNEKKKLEKIYIKLNPAELKRNIDKKLSKI